MKQSFLLLLLLVLTSLNKSSNKCKAFHIISPGNLTPTNINSPLAGEGIGPQNFPPQNGTAIYFRGDYCRPVRTAQQGGIEIGNYTGYVLFISSISGCKLSQAAQSLEGTDATAIIVGEQTTVPGVSYYLSSRFQGFTQVPVLSSSKNDIQFLLDYLQDPNYQNNVIIEIFVDTNYWFHLFDSFAFFFIIRVVLPLFFFPTGLFAFFLLWENIRSKKTSMTNTKSLVFFLEGVVMIINGVILSASALVGTPFLTYASIWYFFTGFPGIEMFTTVIVAMFYHSLNHANRTLTGVVDTFQTRKKLIFCLFILLSFLDLVGGILYQDGVNSAEVVIVICLCISIANFFVGGFLLYEKLRFYRDSKKKARKSRGSASSIAILAICSHAGRWIVPNIFFITLSTFSSLIMAFPLFFSPSVLLPVLFLVFFSRWGVLFAQIMTIKWKYGLEKFGSDKSQSFRVAIWAPPKRSPVVPRVSMEKTKPERCVSETQEK